MPPNLHHRSFHLLTPPRFGLLTILLLIFTPLLCCFLPIKLVLHLISLLQLRIQVFPHLTNYSSHLGYPLVWVLHLYLVVYVHTIQEKRTKSLFGWLGRYVMIVALMSEIIILNHIATLINTL
jgi:hypothetical protein